MSATLEERNMWIQGIDDEFDTLDEKDTWTLDGNPGAQALPTHIVLKVKRNSDASVERFKARVVAGGKFQVYGEKFFETYAPVVAFSLSESSSIFLCRMA